MYRRFLMSEMTVSQREKLLADMRSVVADAEELLRMSSDDASESARALRERLQDSLTQARHKLADMQQVATEKIKHVGSATDDFVHENPWRSIAIGTGAGLLVGILIGRR
jgi:ElaB/YqjD/DUF883 family membrane-anchored ribosome-binding protein